ncbi:MAG: bifunctional precorrin-2 dehydrogenase/sirohydrochlorin ferrochelatase, partial [Thiohalophilus sp.]
MKFLPIFLDIRDKPCLVVGGGGIAARKVFLLLRAGAKVTVVSPQLCHELEEKDQLGEIQWIKRAFTDEDIEHQSLAIAATNNETVNSQIAELARSKNIPVNVVDHPELGTFTMPSIIDRSPVQIAISTGGASPVLARLLRSRLETVIPPA